MFPVLFAVLECNCTGYSSSKTSKQSWNEGKFSDSVSLALTTAAQDLISAMHKT
jgi:hypothetical protein